LIMAIGGTIANLVLALALVPPLGLVGAALSTSISYVAGAFYLFVEFARLTGAGDPRTFAPGRTEMRDYRVLAGSLANSARARRA
jgi:peptidoglycan biosynthesis protein MviN/MurJ (putative lipid II flippase)